jgi:single-stranded-DNA-specific exonuclease
MQIFFAKRVGENHLKLTFGDTEGGRMEAIAFGAYDTDIGPALEQHGGARFHLAGRLDINTFRGRQTIQLRLEDAAPAC